MYSHACKDEYTYSYAHVYLSMCAHTRMCICVCEFMCEVCVAIIIN